MKKQGRKLKLSRQTLYRLQIAGPGEVVGGVVYSVPVCETDACNPWPTQDWGCTTQDWDCHTIGHTTCC